ncbi:MAG: hypothetical protein ABIP39_12895 [Polyangiaceae bacterium]
MDDDSEGPKTRRFTATEQPAGFLVHYTKTADWSDAAFDDAITLDDARKLATARQALGYHTRIVESTTGVEVD